MRGGADVHRRGDIDFRIITVILISWLTSQYTQHGSENTESAVKLTGTAIWSPPKSQTSQGYLPPDGWSQRRKWSEQRQTTVALDSSRSLFHSRAYPVFESPLPGGGWHSTHSYRHKHKVRVSVCMCHAMMGCPRFQIALLRRGGEL